MKAIRIHGQGGPEKLVYEDVPQPHPQQGEVLVHVAAMGVIAPELTWGATYQTRAGQPRSLPIPGHDLSGIVAEVGAGVTTSQKGDAVYALIAFDRDGAAAEYTIALPEELAPRPETLDDIQAAAVPLTALTAWQGLFQHAGLKAGQTVLIHGASGGVGVFAVQMARWAGAHVIGTTSTRNLDFIRELGVNAAIDYTTTRFEDQIQQVDLVFDTVGGETQERSWPLLKKDGVLVSVASPPSTEKAAQYGVRPVWFVVEPDREALIKIGDLIDPGILRPIIEKVLPLSEARQAYEQGTHGHTRGKIVLRVEA